MRVLSNHWLLFFLTAGLSACVAPMDSTDDESADQIGVTSQAVTATRSDIDWWKAQGQVNRNLDILTRAYKDYSQTPKYVGLNCKEWAKKVVLDASHNVVKLPGTTSGGEGWTLYSDSHVQNLGSNIYIALPGDIVQMNVKMKDGSSTPHTAIVSGQCLTNILWIDSNFHDPEDNKVRQRSQTIPEFLSSVTFNGVQRYTLYRINGG
jgi:hypothetical protein